MFAGDTKRMISVILLLCMVVTMLPPLSEVEAAGGRYRYELFTGTIDKNATYLVVSTNAVGEANCLMFNPSGSFQNQKVTIAQDSDGIYIADFEGAEECLFTFSGSSSATMKHGNYFVDVQNQRFTTSSYKVSISRSSSRYRIKANPGARNLRFSSYDGRWDSVTTVNYVYLFKQVETVSEYTVSYDGNGRCGNHCQNGGHCCTGGSCGLYARKIHQRGYRPVEEGNTGCFRCCAK